MLELTENYGVDSYNLGSGFGHFALAVPDVYKTAEAIKKSGESPFHDGVQGHCCTCSCLSAQRWSNPHDCEVQAPGNTPHRDHTKAGQPYCHLHLSTRLLMPSRGAASLWRHSISLVSVGAQQCTAKAINRSMDHTWCWVVDTKLSSLGCCAAPGCTGRSCRAQPAQHRRKWNASYAVLPPPLLAADALAVYTPSHPEQAASHLFAHDAWSSGCLGAGGKLPREAGPVKGGSSVIAFAEDPTGYKWELIERKGKPIREPICQVSQLAKSDDCALGCAASLNCIQGCHCLQGDVLQA